MRTGVDDTVHVQVQIVELFAIGVGTSAVHGNNGAIFKSDRLVFDHRGDDLRVLVGQPPEGRGDTHLVEGVDGRAMKPLLGTL